MWVYSSGGSHESGNGNGSGSGTVDHNVCHVYIANLPSHDIIYEVLESSKKKQLEGPNISVGKDVLLFEHICIPM